MKKLLIALVLLASCSSSKEEGDHAPKGGDAPSAAADAPDPASSQAGAIAGLTGLYEGGGEPRNQMCVVKGKGGEQRFGLIVWGGSQHSCMGSGTVTRTGDRLRLAMAGDSACTIEATISGRTIKLPASVPAGCAYYCGARATLGGASLTQRDAGEAAAMRAKDIVGESLCSGEGG
jgi:hypothetical protein